MYQVTVLYNPPADAAAFDKHYREVHAPLAAKIPGVKSYTMSWGAPGPDGSPPPYHLIAVLTFDSAEEFAAGFGGPEGQAAQNDLANFAQAGVTIITGEAEVVV
ncbi:EthD family reductase [Pseudonocardia acidicola]|uniref:EthD family reductase n=1 Tax=Pseudonocardia acidicola TaxID=2724939 RepID=A0ABX1SHM6_9PSEU|nr:EthD family reductase [Pseudonocardia acidicola]NMI01092.1 EthD family reductase [Pseudonocardia acidicola]